MIEDLEVLISALGKDAQALASGMNLECGAVLVDQCSRRVRPHEFYGRRIKCLRLDVCHAAPFQPVQYAPAITCPLFDT